MTHPTGPFSAIVPDNYVPSGLYVCEPLLISTITLANPFFQQDPPYQLIDELNGPAASPELARLSQEPDATILSLDSICSYAETILTAARTLKELNYDLILCPLRGGRMPGVQVATMLGASSRFRAFNFAYGSQGHSDDRVVRDLHDILADSPAPHRLAVLDTAIGGQGSSHLAELVTRRLRSGFPGLRSVAFHLLHPEGRHLPTAGIYAQRTGELDFGVTTYPVPSLLGEDEPRLLGYDVESDHSSGFRLLRYTTPGKIAVQSSDVTRVYEARRLDEALIGLVGDHISASLAAAPDAILTDPNYWLSMRGGPSGLSP